MSDDVFMNYIGGTKFYEVYEQYQSDYTSANGFDYEALEKQLDHYRRINKLDKLAPMLMLVAKHYMEENQYKLATIYFIECYEVLKQVNYHSIVYRYVLIELGCLQKRNKAYLEAYYYFSKATNEMVMHNKFDYLEFCMQELLEVAMLSRSYERIREYYQQLNQLNITISDRCRLLFEVELLYGSKQYENLYKLLESQIEVEDATMNAIVNYRKFTVKKRLHYAEVMNLSEADEQLLKQYRNQQYYVEYQMFKNAETPKALVIEEMLMQKSQYYMLDIYYDVMNVFYRSDELRSKRRENRETIFSNQQDLKVKLQNMHSNYKRYYASLNQSYVKRDYDYVSKNVFKKRYNEQTTSNGVLIAISFFTAEYRKVTLKQLDEIIKTLPDVIENRVTISRFEHLIWCYFETNNNGIVLKQKINKITKALYHKIKQNFKFIICLPQFITHDFKNDQRLIQNVLLMQEILTYEEQYTVEYYDPKILTLSPGFKANQMIDDLFENNQFYLSEKLLYTKQQCYGRKFSAHYDNSVLTQNLEQHCDIRLKKMLNVEADFKAFELICQTINERKLEEKIFIELSRDTLLYRQLIPRLLQCFSKVKSLRQNIVFEIKEAVLFEGHKMIDEHVEALSKYQFNIALTGYGSGERTGSIRNLKISYLDLSSTLVERLYQKSYPYQMLAPVKEICTKQNILICYAHVDNDLTLQFVEDFGVNVSSGVYYC